MSADSKKMRNLKEYVIHHLSDVDLQIFRRYLYLNKLRERNGKKESEMDVESVIPLLILS